MKLRNRDPLAELERSQSEEIAKYKWVESEKAGHDIGWEKACQDWMQRYFPEWKNYHWKTAVQQAHRKPLPPSLWSARPHRQPAALRSIAEVAKTLATKRTA